MPENKELEEPIVNYTNTRESLHVCKSCGNTFRGFYCNQCGERILEPKDRTFRAFTQSLVQAITFADNKFVRSLWLVIRRPGFLSKEFAEGRRVNYMAPLQLFFVLNLIYFLFPLLQLFNTSLHTQMYLRTHSPLVRKMISSTVGHDRLSFEGYSILYNQKSTSLAKLLIIVFVVLASVPMMIIYRKRNRYFTDHVTLAVELTSFNLAMNAIFLSLFLMLVNKLLHWTHSGWEKYLDDFTLTIIFILTNLYFLFRAGRTFYGQQGKILIVKVVLGMLGLFVALEVYRLVLFLVTFWSL
jgi:hypothetical protein